MQHEMPLSAKHLHHLRWEEESPACMDDGDSGSYFRVHLTRPERPRPDLHVLKTRCSVIAG